MIPSLNPYLPFPEDEKAPQQRHPIEIMEMQDPREYDYDEDNRQRMLQKQTNSKLQHSPSSHAVVRSRLFLQSASPQRSNSKRRLTNNDRLPTSSSTKLLQSSSHSLSTTHANAAHTTTSTNDVNKNMKKKSPFSPTQQQQQQQHLSNRPYKGFSTPFCGLFAASASVLQPPQYQPHMQMHHCNAASPSLNNKDNDRMENNCNENYEDDALSYSRQQQYYFIKQSELRRAHRRTDLCSLTCFGILQSDYTRYLFTHTRPPSLCKRMCLHLLTPLSLFILAGWCSGNIRNQNVNSVVCTALVYCIFVWIATACCRGRKKRVMVRDEILWRLKRRDAMLKLRAHGQMSGKITARMTAAAATTTKTTTTTTTTATNERNIAASRNLFEKTKRDVAAEESDDDDDDDDDTNDDEYDYDRSGRAPSSVLGQSRREMHCAHRMIGCYPSDSIPRNNAATGSFPFYPHSSSTSSPDSMRIRRKDGYGETAISSPKAGECHTDEYVLQRDNEYGDDDMCTKVWRMCFARPMLPCIPCCCCNSTSSDGTTRSYGFHLQFCGLCALAQEAREANIALPRHLRMMDYITMEPFLVYYPRILELRSSATSSFLEHCRALSELSKLLLVSFKAILLAFLIISLSDAVKNWNLADMAVLVTTFLQSFAVMYCVHWGWHRFDLSMDAVIKYFACGFVLCTSMAFAVEFFGLFVFKMITLIVVGLLDVQEVQDNGYGSSRSSISGMQLTMDNSGDHRYLNLIYGFENDSQAVTHHRFLAAVDDILDGFFERQPFAKILYILISSYLMAGLVEELCKYFGELFLVS